MKLETERYLATAAECLANAAGTTITNDAGRSAYLAAFYAAQALIFESTGKVAKTHHGVHSEFSRVTIGKLELYGLYVFLSNAHNLKAVADYEAGPDSNILPERAASAIAEAAKFVAAIRRE